MTKEPDFQPWEINDRQIIFVAFENMCLLDFTGPQTVFWAADKAARKAGRPGYQCHTASLHGGPIRTTEGVVLETRKLKQFESHPIHTLVVPGSFEIQQIVPDSQKLVAWLRTFAQKSSRVASVCSGAFLLAESGLLTGKRVATHWLMCDVLQSRFPDLTVEPDDIFVHDGRIWTSAGVTSCIDLSLAMVEEDCGRDISLEVARELVVFIKRPGGQAQFSEPLRAQSEEGDEFEQLHQWLISNLNRTNISVESLADLICMSPRNFARVYKKKTGRTPAKAIEAFRVEAARRLLESSDQSIHIIAVQCGFGDQERMRTTFLRHLSVVPRDYRRRFRREVCSAV